jgi:signal transduction histidine kinase
MFRTLYVRVVVSFLVIAVISLLASSMIGTFRYERSMKENMTKELQQSGLRIQELYDQSKPEDWRSFLEKLSELQQIYMYVYDASGSQLLSSGRKEMSFEHNYKLEQSVPSVLAGEAFIIPPMDGPKAVMPTLGMTIELAGVRHVMFLEPGLSEQFRNFRNMNLSIIGITLAIGSILIIVAARYLVKPLKLMTQATRSISRGQFDVDLRTSSKDELGQLAASMKQMATELGQFERMRQDFVSNVSHEMQTPLTSISGFAQILGGEHITDAERMRYSKIIEMESNRLSRLSDNLLKLASLDSEHHPFIVKTYRLDRQLRSVVWSCEPLWSAKGIQMQIELDEVKVEADEDGLGQVWMNIIHNAIKFTPDGGLIQLFLSKTEQDVTVVIKDNGIGMNEAHLGRIFERFYKADASRHRSQSHGGSGLGLAISKKIIDLHHGQIQVKSEPGKGTDFQITLNIRMSAS